MIDYLTSIGFSQQYGERRSAARQPTLNGQACFCMDTALILPHPILAAVCFSATFMLEQVQDTAAVPAAVSRGRLQSHPSCQKKPSR